MGYTPIPRIPPPSHRQTRLDRLKGLYVASRIDFPTLEEYATLMLEQGIADEPYYPEPGGMPPPMRADAARSARPPIYGSSLV